MDTVASSPDPEPPEHRSSRSRNMVIVMRGDIRGRIPRQTLTRLADRVCRGERLRGTVHLIVVGDAEMRRLNRCHLGKDRPTDVLSFPMSTDAETPTNDAVLGEVYCNIDHARRWSSETGDTQTAELARLTVHGLLHLAGYDHHTLSERKAMTQCENRYLESAGLIFHRLERDGIHVR